MERQVECGVELCQRGVRRGGHHRLFRLGEVGDEEDDPHPGGRQPSGGGDDPVSLCNEGQHGPDDAGNKGEKEGDIIRNVRITGRAEDRIGLVQ